MALDGFREGQFAGMTENEMRLHRCCFTGHRPQKLTRPECQIKADLEKAIKQAISEGYTTFITGMAYGVDIWAGQIVVRLRERNPDLHLIAAVPFRGFEEVGSLTGRLRTLNSLDKPISSGTFAPDTIPVPTSAGTSGWWTTPAG